MAEDIVAATGNARVLVAPHDLVDVPSIRFSVSTWDGPLHILVNNAGIMACPLTRTAQRWEMQFATNHMGHFALATGLHRSLAAAAGARVISVSSTGYLRSPVVFDDIHFEHRDHDPWLADGRSKTANVRFAVEATRRWADDGVFVNAVMPGVIRTNLQRYITDDRAARMLRGRVRRVACNGGRPHRAPRPPSCWPPHPCSNASAAGTSRTAQRPSPVSQEPVGGGHARHRSGGRCAAVGRLLRGAWLIVGRDRSSGHCRDHPHARTRIHSGLSAPYHDPRRGCDESCARQLSTCATDSAETDAITNRRTSFSVRAPAYVAKPAGRRLRRRPSPSSSLR